MTNKSLSLSVVKKIQMAKALYLLGNSCFETSSNVERIGVGVILLQDAVELFLIALCEYFSIELSPNTLFHQYFSLLKKNREEEIPLKTKMLVLNRQRTDIKHHGILPNVDGCRMIPNDTKSFFEELSLRYFKKTFEAITLIDLLEEGSIKDLLIAAEEALGRNKYKDCQINCRKAFYLSFEKRFDIKIFEEEGSNSPLMRAFCDAPYFTKNKEYIEKEVKNPTDYISIDHDKLDKNLLKEGISPTDFWNIWRLTPSMYYFGKNNEWVIKEEFKRNLYNRENAEYCLSKLVEMLLLRQQNRRFIKCADTGGAIVSTKDKKVNIYEKADLNSRVVHEFAEAQKDIVVHYAIQGFDGKVYFYISKEIEGGSRRISIFGYISLEDVDREKTA